MRQDAEDEKDCEHHADAEDDQDGISGEDLVQWDSQTRDD